MDAATLFQEEVRRAGRTVDDSAWPVALEAAIRQGREAWPDVSDQSERFVRHLADKLVRDESLRDAIEGIRASDLWLAVAYLSGDETARPYFDRTYIPVARSAWRRMGLDTATIEDLEQSLRMELHESSGHRSTLCGYSGRGALRGWVKSTAVHAALKGIRSDQRRRVRDGSQLQRGTFAVDPELDYLRQRYAREVSAAFAAVVSQLTARERTLLRQHFVDGLTCDDLAVVHGIHRSTAARRVERARTRLADGIKAWLRNELRVSETDLESIVRLVGSDLRVSLCRHLAPA